MYSVFGRLEISSNDFKVYIRREVFFLTDEVEHRVLDSDTPCQLRPVRDSPRLSPLILFLLPRRLKGSPTGIENVLLPYTRKDVQVFGDKFSAGVGHLVHDKVSLANETVYCSVWTYSCVASVGTSTATTNLFCSVGYSRM